jgi:hypothetical protein
MRGRNAAAKDEHAGTGAQVKNMNYELRKRWL